MSINDLVQDSGAVMGLLVATGIVAALVKLWRNNKEEQERKNS